MLKQKILLLLLCFVLGFTVAACVTVTELEPVPPETPASDITGSTSFINTLELPAGPYARFALPKLTALVQEKYAMNSDTVGWLQVPNTTVDDVVVWYPHDENLFYYRRNFEKRQSFGGIFYADFRCAFDGTAAGLSTNTVIYGHSMSDNPNHESKLFSPLKFYLDEEFAKENPYLYFSTSGEDLIWEVFAVFYATTALPYNLPEFGDFLRTVGECRARSLYNYDVGVTEKDKILTLSTCTYSLPDGTSLTYPNAYRYAIMAKLVTDKSALKSEARLTKNTDAKAP